MAATAERHRPSFLLDAIHALLLDRFAPPSVLINRQGQVVYIHGRTGDYLEPAPGPANQQVLDMARPAVRRHLMTALQLAEKQGGTVVREGIRITHQGKALKTTLSVTPLHKPDALEGLLLIVFSTGSQPSADPPQGIQAPPLSQEDRELLVELEYTHQQLHRVNEDLQLSNEEFKSANEELQSTNEELQSTNEELETTREELQSLNEELTTVNVQLQNKLDELANTNDDLQNLVNSTEIATIFLDNDMRIKRFTSQAARVSKVIGADIGRPFSDIVSMVRYPELMQEAQQVLHTLAFKEREVQSSDGRWYLLRMIPYRTSKNVIDGLVLSYVDITAGKVARMAAEEARLYAESIVDTVREPLIVLDADLRVVSCNRAFYRKLIAKREDVEGGKVDQILGGQFNHPSLRRVLEKVLVDGRGQDDVEIEMESPVAAKGKWMAGVRRFDRGGEYPPLILLALEIFPDPEKR